MAATSNSSRAFWSSTQAQAGRLGGWAKKSGNQVLSWSVFSVFWVVLGDPKKRVFSTCNMADRWLTWVAPSTIAIHVAALLIPGIRSPCPPDKSKGLVGIKVARSSHGDSRPFGRMGCADAWADAESAQVLGF